jgi:hypothetical protein
VNSLSNVARRIAGLWGAFFGTFVRGDKVLPQVVALLALLLFAWVVAASFVDESGDDGTANEADLARSREPSGSTPVAPAAEARDADSYAAYRNKDPFRQLLAPAAAPSEDTLSGDTPSGDISQANPSDGTTTAPDGNDAGGGTVAGGTGATAGGGGKNMAGAGAGQRSRADSDGDGLINRQEERLGQDPRDPDTDDDGTEDGADDSDGDGIPDGQRGNAGGGAEGTGGAGTETGAGGGGNGVGDKGGGRPGGGGGTGGADGSDDELFDSGGRTYLR